MGQEFNYMLLSRCQQDCKYYLGNGNRHPKHLWAQEEQAHINKMVELYYKVPERPEWISLEDIAGYAKEMGVKMPEVNFRTKLKDFRRRLRTFVPSLRRKVEA